MKRGEKALKYADLVWGDEKVRRITLEDLCRNWAFTDLYNKGEITIGMKVHSYRKKFKLSLTKQITLYYAYLMFHSWAKTTQPHLKTKALHKLLSFLLAVYLVHKLKFCTCKEVFSFIRYDLPRLKARDRKKPRPLQSYQRVADPKVRETLPYLIQGLNNPDHLSLLSKRLGIPLRPPSS